MGVKGGEIQRRSLGKRKLDQQPGCTSESVSLQRLGGKDGINMEATEKRPVTQS